MVWQMAASILIELWAKMKSLLKEILQENKIENNKIAEKTIEKLTDNTKVEELSKTIAALKVQILQIFMMYKDKEEFKESHFPIPNANAKKDYNFIFDMSLYPSIKIKEIRNLDSVGLIYDAETSSIIGVPTAANTIEIQIVFNSKDEDGDDEIKVIPFIVNADPKDLWLNKPSPADGRFPKEDEKTFSANFLDKKIVVASKRGRSHAHDGTFRDDDFRVKALQNEWSIVAIADGAGSAKFARAGSKFATEFIINSFDDEVVLQDLSKVVISYFSQENESLAHENELSSISDGNEEASGSVNDFNEKSKLKNKSIIINALYNKIKNLHTELSKFADSEEASLKDFHTTLIFALVKKFDFGYVTLTFGVGDCPINVMNKDSSQVKLLNFLDVGESSGATRFITMPEIFSRPDMANRFAINCFEDFSKMFLMTDGIYDPKFVVENKLENLDTWIGFLKDLNGENEDAAKVDFIEDQNIENQLSVWMDFWSKGNHDDRTLAIIY